MYPTVRFYSNKDGEIFNFLSQYFNLDYSDKENSGNPSGKISKTNNSANIKRPQDLNVFYHSLEWEHEYENPVEIATILGVLMDNSEKFEIVMWVSLDNGIYIKITPNNANSVIRYLYERYPY